MTKILPHTNWFIFFYGNTKIICHLCVVSGNDFFLIFTVFLNVSVFGLDNFVCCSISRVFSSDFELETRNLANMIKDKPSKNPPSFLSTVDP